LQLIGFDELTLSMVKVPNPSANVNNLVNTHSVAESAALLAANNDVLVVPKQTFKLPLKTEIITLAIAQSKITI
jgi:cobalamin biosynthesis protein CbiG